MRRALACLLLLTVLAAPAGAQEQARPSTDAPPAAQTVLPAPIPLAAARPGRDPLQCKAACARTRYFCDASDGDESCAAQWAQCTARCGASFSRPGA